ncbi:MAG: TonB-dependent receptor [Gemmatimonadales bacterium]|nr:TonB-dependent receptor [Gemmatimonadales bacterium]
MRSPASHLATLVVASLGVATATPLGAQVTTDSTRSAGLPAIVVTATRVPIAAVTAAATVLRGDDLRRQGITTLGEALQLVPGLAVVQTSSPGTRTSVYTRGGESGYTRVLVDGVAVNDPGGDHDYANLTIDDVDRIEVIRGPSSVLYGTDAVSGVIQVFTRQGQGRLRPELKAGTGSFGSRALHGAVSGGNANGGYRIGAGHTRTDGIHAFNSGYSQTFINGTGRAGRRDLGDVAVAVHYSDATVHVPTNGSGAVVDRNAFQSGERVTVGLDLGRQLTQRVEARLLLAEHRTDGGFTDRPDDVADTVGFFAQASVDHVARRSADLRTNVRIAAATVVTFGGLAEQQQQRGTLDIDSEFGPFSSTTDVERITRAGYAQAVGTTAAVAWNLGIRVDHSSVFGTFGTWRGGLAVTATPTTRLRAVAGRAFREPTFYQNFAEGFVIGNPNLRPEQATSWEIGIDQHAANGRVLVRATWFTQHFTDLIEYSFGTVPDAPNYFNVAGARARGIEIEISATLTPRVRADVGYTWLHTEVIEAGFDDTPTGFFVEGVTLLRRPAHSATAAVAWQGGRRSTLRLQAIHRGTREDLDYAANGRATLPAVTTVDLSVNAVVRPATPGRPGLAITGRLSNALDEQYESVLGFRSPGRAFTVALRVD